ncbi:MAG: hypothetical protein ACRDZO_01005 [Egibacteraceae bacterium]
MSRFLGLRLLRVRAQAAGFDLAIAMVGNKVADEQDHASLRHELGADLLACLGSSGYVRAVERGDPRPLSQLEAPTATRSSA